jgi:hypothetical protein
MDEHLDAWVLQPCNDGVKLQRVHKVLDDESDKRACGGGDHLLFIYYAHLFSRKERDEDLQSCQFEWRRCKLARSSAHGGV